MKEVTGVNILIVNGSPRANGNTAELVKQFKKHAAGKAETEEVRIFEKNIKGCMNCGVCQKEDLKDHCKIKDDMLHLYEKFLSSDVTVIASPIYMWQFTPCTLAFLNRLHGLCSHSEAAYNHMEGKKVALLVTLGDEKEVADYAVNGLKDMSEYFLIEFKGDLRVPFAQKEKIASGEYDSDLKDFVAKVLK